jgi:hypothetical protein
LELGFRFRIRFRIGYRVRVRVRVRVSAHDTDKCRNKIRRNAQFM